MFDKTMVKILTSIIQHELGHGFGAWKMGISEYNSIASFYKENWAISYVNKSYRNDCEEKAIQFCWILEDSKWKLFSILKTDYISCYPKEDEK